MELPINKLVGLIIVLIVAVAIIMLFFSGLLSGSSLGSQGELRLCCSKYKANNCDFTRIHDIYCDNEETKDLYSIAKNATKASDANLKQQLNDFCGC